MISKPLSKLLLIIRFEKIYKSCKLLEIRVGEINHTLIYEYKGIKHIEYFSSYISNYGDERAYIDEDGEMAFHSFNLPKTKLFFYELPNGIVKGETIFKY